MSENDHNSPETEDAPLRLVKGSERSKRNGGRLEHSTKLSYWCIGIIVIILLFAFLGNMITDAEVLDAKTPDIGDNQGL